MHASMRWFVATVAVPVTIVLVVPARAEKWPPITAEEKAIQAPRVEPDADAEALFWNVRAEDSFSGDDVVTEVDQHLRIKIFTERGKATWSRVDIPFGNDHRVSFIQARTVLPDGRELPLRESDVFERTVVKERGLKVRMRSFVFPGVVPGAIVEYRWRETRLEGSGLNSAFDLQRDLPVHRITYRIKPILLENGPGMRVCYHNTMIPPLRRDPDGFYSISLENVPAFRAESMMPPEIEVRRWMVTYYSDDRSPSPDRFWREYGKRLYDSDRPSISTGKEIKDAAARITAGATTDEDKLARLYDYCRREIRHLSDDAVVRTPEERMKRDPKNARETLERKEGADWDVDVLFASLAASLGYDARFARLADRQLSFFSRAELVPGLLNTYNVAVKVGGQWRFYDPAVVSLPLGMTRWQEEGQEAILPDAREPSWVVTPSSPASVSCTRRTGVFKLGADGVLEGMVRIEYQGHAGIREKELYDDLAVAGREDQVRSDVRDRIPTAELSAIHVVNADNPDLPFVVEYGMRVPDFAQVTGKRLFFEPSVFHKGERAWFTDDRRTYPVDFRHTWSEYDSVLIQLPDGYELDHGESPANHTIGDFGSYSIRIGLANQGRLLIYRRAFEFNRVRFPREDYDALRSNFDTVHERDAFQLAIRKGDTSAAP
jgi:Domain of Unknown Function with PDB structure (DUF3857)/Transglutaminase-like superfamily